MTFTDYRTAARMRDVIAEVASEIVDRKKLGYRYATVDSIDTVKNRANVTFAGEVSAVPVRMGAIKPTAGALVRVRGKHGDLHVEGIIDGDIELPTITALDVTGDVTVGGNTVVTGDNTVNELHITGVGKAAMVHFIDEDSPEEAWFHFNNGNFYLLPDRDGDGSWETPYPFRVDWLNNNFHFWYGAGGTTSRIEGTGDFYVGRDVYIQGMLFAWVGGGSIVLDNVNEIRNSDGSNTDPSYTFTGSQDSGLYCIGTQPQMASEGQRAYHFANGLFAGIGDNTKNLGTGSHRWSAVYAVDGTINTSDMEEKEEVVDSDLGLEFIKNMRPRRWRWRGKTRPHYGLAAQEVKQALDAIGQDFAGYIDPAVDWEYDPDDPQLSGEQPGPLGLRYHEFIAPMIAAIQELADRVETLEGSPSSPSIR